MGSEFGLTHDTEHKPKLDGLGIFYIVFAGVWTLSILAGTSFLVVKRDAQVLRVRGIALSICAVAFLHCYWVSVQLGYVLGPVYPGDCEYWIMGTWFPLGIALFHASNSRFLHVAWAQKRFVQQDSEKPATPVTKRTALLARFRRMDHTVKASVLVGAGMVFQVLVTVLMYLMSRKWHSSWGIPGTEIHAATEMERKTQEGRGWEWWPSVFWQFFWAWIVAPIVLWKSRGIHDTQGWRLQTIACCVASLHATPMWLIALYVPQMEKVNQYFIPPQWICVSIMVLEVFTIFLPCWEVHRHQNLKQETLDSIAQWESKNNFPTARAKSITSGSTMVDSAVTGWKSTDGSFKSSSNESILTMGALEHILKRNPQPLLQFSALKDFSGENIAFLTSVAEWKSTLPPAARDPEKLADDTNTKELVRERFNRAVHIYAEYISSKDAQFQINLPSPTLKKLESIFESSARVLYGEKRSVDPATPFDAPDWSKDRTGPAPGSSDGSEKEIVSHNASEVQAGDRAQYWGEVPEGFSETVFDEAEESIKYLVLTNTWPKFVKERRSSMESIESV